MTKKNLETIIQQGVVAYNESSFQKAEIIFKKATKLYPDQAEAHYKLGFIFL